MKGLLATVCASLLDPWPSITTSRIRADSPAGADEDLQSTGGQSETHWRFAQELHERLSEREDIVRVDTTAGINEVVQRASQLSEAERGCP
jgi:hypothetical protein